MRLVTFALLCALAATSLEAQVAGVGARSQASSAAIRASGPRLGTETEPVYVRGTVGTERTEHQAKWEKKDSDEKTALDTRVANATEWGAILTACMLVAALGQIVLFVWQLRLMRATVADAKVAAEAAKTSADASMRAERAYVKINHTVESLKWNASTLEVQINVKNYGRTPASVTDVRIGFKMLENGDLLAEPFPLKDSDQIPTGFLVPDESLSMGKFYIPPDVDAVRGGSRTVWIFGWVDYIDTFGVRHRGGYVRKYEPHSHRLLRAPERGYDFDRRRTAGEGNDWPA